MSKSIPPASPEPDLGVRYWRGLDDRSGSPEFQALVEREFPAGASELTDPASRRDFVKLMGASLALAGFGLTGCRRPEEVLQPFGRQPEGYTHGVPQYYATAMPSRTGAVPLVAKQHDGRPIKVEGNDQVPGFGGGTDLFAQASILDLYDPDRARRHTRGGNAVPVVQVQDFLSQAGREAAAKKGAGLAILTDHAASPTRERLLGLIQQRMPEAKVYAYEPVDFDIHRRAASLATGRAVGPNVRLERARAILSLDADFLGTENDGGPMTRGFARTRKVSSGHDPMSRLYVVEPLLTLTGSSADHRLRLASGQVLLLAAAIARELLPDGEVKSALAALPAPAGVDARWITECAADLSAHRGRAVVLAGIRQPLAVHLIAHALNASLDGFGKTVTLIEAPAPAVGSLADLAKGLDAGQVETLVILHGNPVLTAPADLDWARAQRKARTVVRLGFYEDETTEVCDWHLAAAHYLESWGDARASDGTVLAVQPLIAPLFGGLTEAEVLARLAGETATRPHEVIRATFFTATGGQSEDAWEKFLYLGYLADSAAKPVSDAVIDATAVSREIAVAPKPVVPGKDSLDLVFTRDAKIDDGRHVNNTWLQELPDPVTKLTWDNALLVSRRTATELGLVNSELVRLQANGREMTAPVWVVPGMADHTLAISLGYGRTKPGRGASFKGTSAGFNAYPLRMSATPSLVSGAKVTGTGETFRLAVTQSHWAMAGRPIVREANLEQFKAKPDFARNFDLDAHVGHIPHDANGRPKRVYQHAWEERPDELKSDIHQWGMVVDLGGCTGCGACVMACQAENNIPVVGKDQVLRGREMHWLRIDRYFTGMAEGVRNPLVADENQWKEDWIDDPQVVNQPMMCQHCENAPCESVCPVNATVHDAEGLNLMAYNRCIGTRYCANNCAWKVRRFNFFDYNKRPIDYAHIKDGMRGNLYKGPLAKRDAADQELVRMAKNPDVSVRMRGVMEKCTFCTQRIEGAKIAQKVKAGASGDVQVRDGAVKTACQQACPAEAIVFGNLLDPGSRVSQLKKQSRNYEVLGFLDNRARVTYLARIRNPNPKMPDFREFPLSIEDYQRLYHSNPFGAHGAGHAAGDGHAAPAGAAAKGGH
ncbi:MAG: TAT-variant-translocated molybdopterin oxidoreductase [Limisphaerales bacterium]